jgi:hypothetical protein
MEIRIVIDDVGLKVEYEREVDTSTPGGGVYAVLHHALDHLLSILFADITHAQAAGEAACLTGLLAQGVARSISDDKADLASQLFGGIASHPPS